MGRALRRKAERRERLEGNKGTVRMNHAEISKMKNDIIKDVSSFNTERLLTCFALTLYRKFDFDADKISEAIGYLDWLMNEINEDRATMNDYIRELEEEANIIVRCEDDDGI